MSVSKSSTLWRKQGKAGAGQSSSPRLPTAQGLARPGTPRAHVHSPGLQAGTVSPWQTCTVADRGIPGANTPFVIMTAENASAAFLGGTRGKGRTQSICWEPDNGEIYGGAGRHKQRCAAGPQPSRSILAGKLQQEGGPVAHLGGCEDDDVLDVSPGEARPHLQHQRDHPGGERSRSRRPRVALRAPRALLQIPVCCHLWRQRGEASCRAALCRAGVPGLGTGQPTLSLQQRPAKALGAQGGAGCSRGAPGGEHCPPNYANGARGGGSGAPRRSMQLRNEQCEHAVQEEGQQLPSWQGTRQMVESLRVSAARGRYVEARLLISCMSTPSSVQDGAQAGRFS